MSTVIPYWQASHFSSDNVDLIFNSAAIYDLIFSCLSAHTIISCSKTCRVFYRATRDFNVRAYNISRHLSRFFEKPLSFRSIQASTGAVISGSNAIQFFDRCFYEGSDLDIFVAHPFALQIAEWLISEEGYLYKPLRGQDVDITKSLTFSWINRNNLNGISFQNTDYRCTGMCGVFDFIKDGEKKIQLIIALLSPIHCILSFHSTCVMNFITFEAAYSLYPRATFDTRDTIALGTLGDQEGTALAKYAARGWTVYAGNWDDKRLSGLLFFDRRRYITDRYTWTIPFDTLDITLRQQRTISSIPFTSDPSQYNSWVLRTKSTLHMKFHSVSSPTLVYAYVVASKKDFIRLTEMLQTQEKLELLKTQHAEGDKLTNEAWTFWDGLYAKWCRR